MRFINALKEGAFSHSSGKILEVERGKKAEGKINEGLNNMGKVNIKFITQATKGSLLITTIFYD